MSRSPIERARDWLDAADPGAVRRMHGARVVLAALATFFTLEGAQSLLGEPRITGAVTYGVFAAFVGGLTISDPRRRDRAATLALSVPALAAAATLAALTEPVSLLPSAALLVLVFFAFAARRRGLRAGELALIATTGMYFATGAEMTLDDIPWFIVAAAVGVGWLAAWQFVLLPYDPVRSIRGATHAYAERIAGVVARVAKLVAEPGSDSVGEHSGGKAAPAVGLARDLRKAQLTRRVVEAQFPGARAPGGWTSYELTRMQVALYDAELGASQMVDGCADPDGLHAIPSAIREALASTLAAIAEALADMRDAQLMETLAERADELRDRVMDTLETIEGGGTTDPPAWIVAGLRIANGGRRVAHAVATARSLQATVSSRVPADPAESHTGAARQPARVAGTAQVRIAGRAVHVTTALGLQAVLATGLSMGVALLAGVEHPSWVFWTSFLVIAGSLDETLRRMLERVVGTVLGVVAGVTLAALLPDDLIWVVILASLTVFLAIYAAPISHAVFVFWLNAAFALAYANPGGNTVELLVARPLMTIVGSAIAALIVVRVLPIRHTGRYAASLVAFLTSIREAVRQWTTAAGAGTRQGLLPAIDASYREVELTGRTRNFGTMFGEARKAAETEATEVAALAVAVTRLGTAVELEPDEARQPLPAAVGARIDRNLGAAISLARGAPATLVPTVDDLLSTAQRLGIRRPLQPAAAPATGDRDPLVGGPVPAAMVDVHASVVRLGAALADRRDAGQAPSVDQ